MNMAKTRLSRIVLVKENSVLIFNDRFRVKFHHRQAFLLAWVVCKTIVRDPKFQSLGGIPPEELCELCQLEGLNLSRNALNTLWHDEVEFRRHHNMIFSMFEVTDLKNGTTLTKISSEFLADMLQLVFGKVRPPEYSNLHRNIRLFAVLAEPEQILVFHTLEEAQGHGIQPSGLSDITKFRKNQGEIGFIYWKNKVKVNDSGSADSLISTKLVNLSTVPLLQHMLPLWSDTYEHAENRKLKAWLKNGTNLTVEIMIGKEDKKKKVEFLIIFPCAIQPGKTVEFSFSYHTHKAYSPGKEYFTWYFDHPHMKYLVDLQFSKFWRIRDPIVFKDDKDEDLFQVKQLSLSHIKWIRFFPTVGAHYKIYFFLSRAGK